MILAFFYIGSHTGCLFVIYSRLSIAGGAASVSRLDSLAQLYLLLLLHLLVQPLSADTAEPASAAVSDEAAVPTSGSATSSGMR